MKCPACGVEASPGARFCASCGAELSATCAVCGAELPAGARFCSICGTAVGEVPTTPEPDPGVERKIVSVLFADLAGFTAASSEADPEDVAARLGAFHTAVRADIERFGGRIEKLIGDGVFAIFGAPHAHEDDAERAVRAALRLQDTLSSMNTTPGLDLSVRIAVTTGEAMVRLAGTSQDQEGVVGDVVNTASRLQQVAPEGGVLVDQRTHAATQRVVEYDVQEPVTVKGKIEPLTTWVAGGVRSRFGVGVEVPESTAFVGRDDSLRLLVDSFERAVQANTAHLVTVSGEPGVGKTRLVAEFRSVLDDRDDLVWWRQGHCLPYGDGVSFWALGEIVKAHAGVLDGEPTEVAREKVLAAAEELIEDPQEASWVGGRLLELIGASTGESGRDERFSAWAQFLETLAGRNPLVLVVDDLHWADAALVEFLDELVETVVDAPMLVVVTARPELYDAHEGWGGGKRNSTTLALGPLSSDDTAQLVSMLDGAADAEAIAVAVQRSGGNPLYATELMRMAADRQETGTGDGAIPESIHAVIASRIDLLGPADKEILQAAAVVGKVFWSGAIAFATGSVREDLDESLRRLSRRELVRRARRSSMRDQDEYTFWHDLVADVAYGQIPRDRRRAIHEAMGRWLEATAGERIGEVAEILAHHFVTALELGADDELLRQSARRHLFEAARRVENTSVDKATDLFERALELSASPEEQAPVLIRLTHVVGSAIGGQETVELGRRAVAAAESSGDVALHAEALTVLSRAHWVAGEGEESHASTRRALHLATELPDGPTLTRVLAESVATMYLKGDFDGLQELIDRALDVGAEHGPIGDYLGAMKWAGTFVAEQGDRESGIAQLEAAHAGAVDHGLSRLQITSANNLASFYILEGRVDEAIELCEQTIATGHARGLHGSADFTRLTLSEALWHAGRWQEVPPHADYLLETYGSFNVTGQGGLWWRAQIAVMTGAPDAQTWADESLEMARRAQDHQALVPALMGSIELCRRSGDIDDGLLLVHEFEKMTEDRPFFRVGGMAVVAPFLERAGELDLLEQLLDVVPAELDRHPSLLGRAILAHGRGDLDGALEHLETALQSAASTGSPWQEAAVRIRAAAVRIDRGQQSQAAEELNRAEQLLQALGGSVFDDDLVAQRARL